MTSYNIFSKLAIAASLLVGLSSCMNRDQHVTENGATFYVDSITPSFAPNKVNPNGDVSQKFINMKACLKDNAQKSIIMNVPFSIGADSVQVKRVTDRDGCMTWQEMFEFNPTTHERQIAMTRTFVALSGHYGSVNADITYNPWKDDLQYLKLGLKSQSAEKATIVYSTGKSTQQTDDFTGATSTTQVDLQADLKSTELVPLDIANMRMDFLKRDFEQYEVSKTLGLTIAHQYRLNFVVNSIKQTLDHGPTLEPVNQGTFRFRFLLLKEGYDSSKKMTAQQALPFVIGETSFDTKGVVGRFRKDITLKFNDISALANRMTGILTVESLDQPDTFAVSTFEGMVTPVAGAGTQILGLLPSTIDGKTLWSLQTDRLVTASKVKAFDLLVRETGFAAAKDAAPGTNQGARSAYDFSPIFKSKTLPSANDSNFAAAVCYHYFIGMGSAANPAYGECLKDAASSSTSKMLSVSLRDLVEDVIDPMPTQTGIPQDDTITISSGLDFTDRANNEEGATYKKDRSVYGGFGAELSIGNAIGVLSAATKVIPIVATALKMISFFGLSADVGAKMSYNKDWYYSSGLVQNQTQGAEVQTSHSQAASSEAFTFQINLATRTCLLMVPSPDLIKLMANLVAPQGEYFCTNDIQKGPRNETYYFITQTNGITGSPMSDSMSSVDNPLRMFMRGPKTYDMFTLFLTQKGFDVNLKKMNVEDRTKALTDDLKAMVEMNQLVTQEFPGMLTVEQTAAPIVPSAPISTQKTGMPQPCSNKVFSFNKCKK